jgi:hypothetical protein
MVNTIERLVISLGSPKGKRKRGRPKETLRRTIQREAKTIDLKTQDLKIWRQTEKNGKL